MKRILMCAVAAAALTAGPAFAQGNGHHNQQQTDQQQQMSDQNGQMGDQNCPTGQDCQRHRHGQQQGESGQNGGQQGGNQMQGSTHNGSNNQMQGSASTHNGGNQMQQGANQGAQTEMQGNNSGNNRRHDNDQADNGRHRPNHDEMQSVFRSLRVAPLPSITFNIGVGGVVPHHTHLYAVPRSLYVYYPSYRHYRYFMLADGSIVIVNPRTWRIVDVIRA